MKTLRVSYEKDSNIARIDIAESGAPQFRVDESYVSHPEGDVEVVAVEELPNGGIINLEFKMGHLVGIEVVGADETAPGLIEAANPLGATALSQTA